MSIGESALVRHLTKALSKQFSTIQIRMKDMEELHTQVQSAVWESQERFQDQIQQRLGQDLKETMKTELESQRKVQNQLQFEIRKERRRDQQSLEECL